MENKRLKRARLYTLLLFIYFFTILIIPKAYAEVAYIDRESTEVIYPEGQNCVDTNQTAIMSVKVTTPDAYGIKTYLMAIKVYGENVTIVPSSDQNFTINDYSHKVLEFQLKPQIYGALAICIELWHEGGQIDFYSLPLKADKPPPYVPLIYISESDTSISPNPAFPNETCKLNVGIYNGGTIPINAVIKVYGENLILFPVGQQNITLQIGSNKISFSITPSNLGTFLITIELWYENQQVDFTTLDLEVAEQKVIYIPREMWLSPIFAIGLISLVHFLVSVNEEDEWKRSVGYGTLGGVITLIIIGIIYGVERAQRVQIMETLIFTTQSYVTILISTVSFITFSLITYKLKRKRKMKIDAIKGSFHKSILITLILGISYFIFVTYNADVMWLFSLLKLQLIEWKFPLAIISIPIIALLSSAILLRRHSTQRLLLEKTVLKMAKSRGGILTASDISIENEKISIMQAKKSLNRLVHCGEARSIKINDFTVYDIPSTRGHLSLIDRMLIEILLSEGGRLSKDEFLNLSKLDPKAFNERAKCLEREGVIIYKKELNQYSFKSIEIIPRCPQCGKQLAEEELEKLRKGKSIKCKCGTIISLEDVAKRIKKRKKKN